MSARHPLADGRYCIPGPFHLPPYETGQIWRRDAKAIPGFERGFSTVPHLGAYFTRWINRLSTDVDSNVCELGRLRPEPLTWPR